MDVKKVLVTTLVAMSLYGTAFAEEYKLHAGDRLNIKVLRYGELNAEYLVRSDGNLTFPLLGEIPVEGMTALQLADSLNESLKKYCTDPEVYVTVASEGTTRVYLFGEITRPGLYELKKSRTVLDAISAGGSYTERTAKKRIFLIRKGQDDKPIKINLKKMLEKGDLSQNYELQEGDILFFKDNGKLF